MLLLTAALTALLLSQRVGVAGAARPVLRHTTLERIAFLSPTRGVGLFETATGNGPGRCVIDVRPTTDGGSSFERAGAPLIRSRCGMGEAFSQITFDSGGVLFAFGPGLKTSRNMGRTWHAPKLPGAVVALTTHGRSAWALITRCHPTGRTCRLTLTHSANGGATWRPLAEQPPRSTMLGPVAYDAEHGMTSLLGVTPDGAVVLALERQGRSVRGMFPSNAVVETLEPGARRWHAQNVPCASAGFQTELSIGADGSEWLACSGQPSTGVQPKSLAVSNDHGSHWRLAATMCTPGSACRERMPIAGYLGGLAALNSRIAFYVGGRSSLTGTFDGGMRWRVWSRIGGGATATLQVTFCGSLYGWAVVESISAGGPNLWRTRDGGRSWTAT